MNLCIYCQKHPVIGYLVLPDEYMWGRWRVSMNYCGICKPTFLISRENKANTMNELLIKFRQADFSE